jgi:hypothetical protein
MQVAVEIVQILAGVAIIVSIADAAIRTYVLPRPSGVTVSRLIARAVRWVFDLFARRATDDQGRDKVLAVFGPIMLLVYMAVWLAGLLVGFALLYEAVSEKTWDEAFRISGSALLTLGFAVPGNSAISVVLVFVEAAAGLLLVALLIAYLPTIYNAFSRRETAVTRLSVRAGTPPTPTELLVRAHRAGFMDQIDDFFTEWEAWFVEVEETHTSLGMLAFYRSPNPSRSWIIAAGAVLDAAAIRASTLSIPFAPNAGLCIRAGYLALREIAAQYGVAFDADPSPDEPISVSREEYFEVYEALAEAGVPVRPDREAAWRGFSGWRVNYDEVLLAIAHLVDAPIAPWVSDRSINVHHRIPLRKQRRRRDAGQTIR